MTKAMKSRAGRRAGTLAACAMAVGMGAGIVSGTGMASADIETDPTAPPSDTTGGLGPTLDTVTDIAKTGPKVSISEFKVTLKLGVSSPRIVTNHSLTTARLV
jgi:hypothetical protein